MTPTCVLIGASPSLVSWATGNENETSEEVHREVKKKKKKSNPALLMPELKVIAQLDCQNIL